jgi:hypothetical protein
MKLTDLSSLCVVTDKPRRMVIKHPGTLDPLTVGDTDVTAFIDLYPPECDAGRKHEHICASARARSAWRGTRPSSESIEADRIERLAILTSNWLLVSPQGERIDVPCTIENARSLFSEPALSWIRSQAETFVDNPGNFIPSPDEALAIRVRMAAVAASAGSQNETTAATGTNTA